MVYAFFTSSPRPLQELQPHIRYMKEGNQNMLSFYEKKMNTTLKQKKKRKRVRKRDRDRKHRNGTRLGQIIRTQYTDRVSGSS